MKNKDLSKKLLNTVFNLIKETTDLNNAERKSIESICSEDTTIMGLKLYEKPLNKLIENIDNYFDKFIDKSKYNYAGENIAYILYENNLFYKDGSESEQDVKIKLENGKTYHLNTLENSIEYLVESVIEDFIEQEVKVTEKTRIEIEKEVNVLIMNELLKFHSSTISQLHSMMSVFEKTLNTEIDELNHKSIHNLEKQIESPLMELNPNIWEDIFYEWTYNFEYGDLRKPLFFYKNQEEVEQGITTYEIKNQEDFCKWFLYDFNN